MSDYKTYQSKLLHITLNDKERYKSIVERIDAECFDAEYRPIVQGIFHAHVSDMVLTANAYEDFIQRSVNAGDYKKWTGSDAQPIPAKLGEKRKFTSIQKLDNVKSDEFDFLMTKVKESYDRSRAEEVISKFAVDQKGDFYGALAKLSEKANGIASSKDDATFKTMDFASSRKEWLDTLKDKRANPEQIISTGLKDIDECLSKSITEPGILVFFVADVGGFKCSAKDELVQIGSGEYISAQELYERYNNGEDFSLLSLGENQRIYKQSVLQVMDNGVQPCYRITTKSGQTSVMTGNHPYLTFNGYKRLDKLEVGEHVAIARIGIFGESNPGPDIPTWVGCMIADGGTSQRGYRFSNQDKVLLNKLIDACCSLGGRASPVKNSCFDSHVTGLRSLGKRYQIDGKLAIHKFVCREIYSWNKSSLSKMLAAMYGCDGTFRYEEANGKKKVQVIYHTSSEQLAIDIRNLLLKFGIISSIRSHMSYYKRKDGSKHERQSYRVYIRNVKECASFVSQIGFLGEKQERAKEWLFRYESGEFINNPNNDIIPNDIISLVRMKFINGKTEYDCRRFLKGSEANRSNSSPIFDIRNKGISRNKLRRIAEYLDNDRELLDICDSDIYWDEIIAIEYIGEDQTYDIAMPVDHNFVANNFITHNTTTMLNIALNVLKQSQENVMFVSLEMPAHLLMDKIISRESGVPGKKLSYPHLMTEQEIQRVERELDKWDNLKSKFIILDAVDGATVADIARAVEQHSHAKPALVVVDYLTILKPEAWYAKLGQHAWFGYMCKSLRMLGKKHGFSIISAAQLGRDAIKRLKSQKEGAQTVGSEDIRGSHDLSADADALFIQVPLPSEPNEKIQVFCAKSRYGDKTFGGKNSVLLNVKPSVGRVSGERDAAWKAELQMQPMQAATNYEVPIDINADVPNIDPDLDILEDDQPPISDSIFGDTLNEDSLGDGF